MQIDGKTESCIYKELEAKAMDDDLENWNMLLNSMDKSLYVPLQYKPEFLHYQEEYFKNVYNEYRDISMVLYRGGQPVGIWPVCLYSKDEQLIFGTAGTALMQPLLPALHKAEAQRAVIENCLKVIFNTIKQFRGDTIHCTETILEQGGSQWIRKLMEHGAKALEPKWQAFTDLKLTYEEIQSRIRRTNKYSVDKGREAYNIEIYDENSSGLDEAFEEFHRMHCKVAGRETRSQSTWDIQKKIIREGSAEIGRSFLIFIRDKETKVLVGSALFDTTPQTGLYCVAAYDRSQFSKPVGHIVQAVAMERMRSMGIRWYEIGERCYPGDPGANNKLVDIGHYKEGFATNFFPRVYVRLDSKTFEENILK